MKREGIAAWNYNGNGARGTLIIRSPIFSCMECNYNNSFFESSMRLSSMWADMTKLYLRDVWHKDDPVFSFIQKWINKLSKLEA